MFISQCLRVTNWFSCNRAGPDFQSIVCMGYSSMMRGLSHLQSINKRSLHYLANKLCDTVNAVYRNLTEPPLIVVISIYRFKVLKLTWLDGKQVNHECDAISHATGERGSAKLPTSL